MQASPVCGPSWIYPWQPTIWVVPRRKPVYYQMLRFEINLNTVIPPQFRVHGGPVPAMSSVRTPYYTFLGRAAEY